MIETTILNLEPDFFVVKTEDGEIRVLKDKEAVQKLVEFYISHGYGEPYSIREHKFGESI